ncbi:MAG: HAMP domain-containing sensor histidine kinase [Actinomycetota bacterium]
MRSRSLRAQLVAMGLLATVLPLLIQLGVVVQVEETVTDGDPGAADGGAAAGTLEVSSETALSPWVPGTTAALALVAVVAVWFWADRAVRPLQRMTDLSDEVQAGSLDRRLELETAPIEIRRLGRSFDRMLDRLAAASASERRLIEDASHELRTPLAALAARLEIAARRQEEAQTAADLARCEEEVERMQATLDGLLASARSRQAAVGQVDNDVAAIVRRVVERQRLLDPVVAIEVSAPQRLLVGVDGPSIERAVANLVDNAVEHGQGADVAVAVTDDDDGHVTISVTDSGPGIEPDRLSRIFDRYQGRHHGIGLALVRHVADAYGSVEVVSPVADGRGTRFTLRLDRADGRIGG